MGKTACSLCKVPLQLDLPPLAAAGNPSFKVTSSSHPSSSPLQPFLQVTRAAVAMVTSHHRQSGDGGASERPTKRAQSSPATARRERSSISERRFRDARFSHFPAKRRASVERKERLTVARHRMINGPAVEGKDSAYQLL